MISGLQELVAPFSEREFSEILRTRTLTLRRSSGENRFKGLLDWETYRSAVESGTVPIGKYRVTKKTRHVPPIFYTKNGKIDKSKFANLIDHGASLVSSRLDRYMPALGALCGDIRAHVAEYATAGAVMTTGSGGALRLHYDNDDIIVLQLEGSKRWMIYGQPVANPLHGMPEQPKPQSSPIFDEVLRPGDFLFLPAGYWHHCENGPELSLHVVILFRPPSGLHAVHALMPQLLAEEIFRVPLTRFSGETEKAAHEAALKARLIEKITQFSMLELPLDAMPRQTHGRIDEPDY